MKLLFAFALSALMAVPTYADTGVHIHPHGTEGLLSILTIALLVSVIAYLKQRRGPISRGQSVLLFRRPARDTQWSEIKIHR